MRLSTPEKTELITISSVKPYEDGLSIEGKIMGTMPMKAVLRPEDLRSGLRLLSFRLLVRIIAMLFSRSDRGHHS